MSWVEPLILLYLCVVLCCKRTCMQPHVPDLRCGSYAHAAMIWSESRYDSGDAGGAHCCGGMYGMQVRDDRLLPHQGSRHRTVSVRLFLAQKLCKGFGRADCDRATRSNFNVSTSACQTLDGCIIRASTLTLSLTRPAMRRMTMVKQSSESYHITMFRPRVHSVCF